jgi:protein involved in polysaccharide export with SLBB domain
MKFRIAVSFIIVFYFSAHSQNIQNKNLGTDLVGTATISVTIGGSFPITGTFPALMAERVDGFISRIYNQAIDQTLKVIPDPDIYRKLKEKLNEFALRGIKLKRANGEELIIDLQKFRLNGDFSNNPYLKNDDVIIFPPFDISRNFFSVSGAVNYPGVFLFVEGDKLGDVLELVGGTNPAYERVDSLEISRLSFDGKTQTIIKMLIDKEFPIQRGDRLRFLAYETQKRNFSVSVIGEVRMPSDVPITKDKTTLYDVIQACGGFTDRASLKRARVYTRNSLSLILEEMYGIKLNEQPYLENPKYRNIILNLELALMYRMSNVVTEDTNYFNLENQLRVLIEGSSLDFRKVQDPNSDIAKYILKDGDIVIVPPIQNSVYIFGQVSRPGHVTFIDGKDYKYYIDEAGGFGELALDDDVMIIKGGSRAWISPEKEDVKIEEGDYIYVPKENLRTLRSYILEYSVYMSLLASIAAILLSIVTIVNK